MMTNKVDLKRIENVRKDATDFIYIEPFERDALCRLARLSLYAYSLYLEKEGEPIGLIALELKKALSDFVFVDGND